MTRILLFAPSGKVRFATVHDLGEDGYLVLTGEAKNKVSIPFADKRPVWQKTAQTLEDWVKVWREKWTKRGFANEEREPNLCPEQP